MSAGTHGMKFDSARTVISASISSVSVDEARRPDPAVEAPQPFDSVEQQPQRRGRRCVEALRASLMRAVRIDAPSPLVGEGYSEVHRIKNG